MILIMIFNNNKNGNNHGMLNEISTFFIVKRVYPLKFNMNKFSYSK